MSRLLTGDQHFFHANIIAYCHRPFADVAEMNAVMEHHWNAAVAPSDEVYVLGDFALNTTERLWDLQRLFGRLPGRKVLVKGNHDGPAVLELPWDDVVRDFAAVEDVMLVHDGERFLRRNGPLGKEWRQRPIFCGNVHDTWKVRRNLLNCGVDVWHFRPVPWKVAREFWQSRWDYWTAQVERERAATSRRKAMLDNGEGNGIIEGDRTEGEGEA